MSLPSLRFARSFAPVLALVLSACPDPDEPAPEYTLDVQIEALPGVDLATYASFDVVTPITQAAEDPPYDFALIEDELVAAIVAELVDKGLTRDPEAPELLINPIVNVREVDDRYRMFGSFYGWYWGYQYLWTAYYEFTRGTLILDVVDQGALDDPYDDLLVYRGIARGLMAEDIDVIRLELRNATAAIFAQWP